MKIKQLILYLLVLTIHVELQAQEKQTLTLREAIDLSLANSDQAKLAETKVDIAKADLQSLRNLRYPDVKINSQYQYITKPKINLKTEPSSGSSGGGSPVPNVHQIVFGQAMATEPIFTGFKLKNTIKAGESNLQATVYGSKNEKEQLVLQTIHDYINLYKARKTVNLLEENLVKSKQRVADFTAKEANGLLARNDLLKAQMQQASDELALEEARKNEQILNYTLALTLKLPENTFIETDGSGFGEVVNDEEIESGVRNDLQSLVFQKQAANYQVKVAKSAYYPSFSLMTGYVMLNIQNLVSIQNAMNIGVGFSYNLASIFKARSEVEAAENRVRELELNLNQMTDKIQVEVQNAQLEYRLAIKKQQVYTVSQEQAEENYRIIKDKYDNDLADINELLEADVDQLQSRINMAYAKADISEKYYNLLTAKGDLTNSLSNK